MKLHVTENDCRHWVLLVITSAMFNEYICYKKSRVKKVFQSKLREILTNLKMYVYICMYIDN
jgi:hypothetical protein